MVQIVFCTFQKGAKSILHLLDNFAPFWWKTGVFTRSACLNTSKTDKKHSEDTWISVRIRLSGFPASRLSGSFFPAFPACPKRFWASGFPASKPESRTSDFPAFPAWNSKSYKNVRGFSGLGFENLKIACGLFGSVLTKQKSLLKNSLILFYLYLYDFIMDAFYTKMK